jgi:hypothetical protein
LDDVSLNLLIGSTTGSPILIDFEELECLGHGETPGICKDVVGDEVTSGWSTRISWINKFWLKRYEFVLESALNSVPILPDSAVILPAILPFCLA